MERNIAKRILESGEFERMSPENFLQWLRALEHAPPDYPEEPSNNDQHVEEPAIPDDEMFTEDEVQAIGGALGMMADELRTEALDRERALIKRIQFLEEELCDDRTIKRNAIYNGRPGTMHYFNDDLKPTSEARATRARMDFDDGSWKSLVLREDNNVLRLPRRIARR